jgi:hypothetical protein
MIREALDELERTEGAIALTLTPRTVEYFRAGDLQRHTSDLLAPHMGYLCAVLGVQDRISLADVRAKLGFLAERPMSERDQLMAQLDWPLETLTLEELQARAKA